MMKKCILWMFALLLVTMCVLPQWNSAQAASGKTVRILDSGVQIVLPSGTTVETEQERKATYGAPYGSSYFVVTVDITKWALKDSGDFAGYRIQYNGIDMYVEEKATNNCAVRFNGKNASYTVNFLDLHGNACSLMYDVFGISGPTDDPTDTTDPELADLKYTVHSDHVEITGYSGRAAKLEIPAEIEGSPVTSIGTFAFDCCGSLTSITLPDSLKSIGSYAFNSCINLTSITLPEGLTTIGGNAFWNCKSLTSITLPDSVTTIGYGAFHACKSLTSITFPDSLTSIDNKAFSSCSSLTSITLPDCMTSIGFEFFRECNNLTSVVIPDGVTSIGYAAFYNCGKLTNIKLPDGVTSIGEWAFYYCESMTSISIPAGVTSIGKSAFYGCKGLKSIYFYGLDDIIIADNAIPGGATIYCYRASAVAGWAAENGYKVVYLDGAADDYDIDDALLVMQHIAGWNVSTDLNHVDVNASGSVDLQDALLILRYVSGEDVELR